MALICPDQEMLENYRKETNEKLPSYMKITKFILHPGEFEKTPKRSIKRYLYQEQVNQ